MRLLAYAKANVFSAGHICQGVYYENVNHSPKSHDLVLLFAALSDRTRLRLLNLMHGREVCVCYFVEILGQSQPKISRHLAYLRRAGIVAARRERKWVHYKMVVPSNTGAAGILRETLAALREDKGMRADLTRLSKSCCVPRKVSALARKVSALEGAPMPAILETPALSSR
jgi:ArsR family transcriptional regulator, arsenate/arsenite/antimonite-responsive transcriptional repressor